MPERPLLILPTPEPIDPPNGPRGGSRLRFPGRQRQIARLGPLFNRLGQILGREGGAIELRDDPTSLAPDRVIVFEVAGSVRNFADAVARVPGLELMAEYEAEFAADEDFAVVDERKGREGQDRTDKAVSSRFYLAMPDVQALRQLVSLWERWERGLSLDVGSAPFAHLFAQLHDVRPWGPRDRIPDETIEYWQEETDQHPDRSVRTEVELWFHQGTERRRRASEGLRDLVRASGGDMVHEADIPEIAYHGALIDIPRGELSALIERRAVRLALADDVMFLRPQSLFVSPIEAEPSEADAPSPPLEAPELEPPIAALFDGVPVPAHALLDHRLILDDPDDLQSRAVVTRRVHATAMASLLLHGDRNVGGQPLGRPIYVRPLMYAPPAGRETTDDSRLLVDTVYRAVLRMKGSEGEEPTAPTVFLVNLSMGDPKRPFTGTVSPLARLLDFLADRYRILFLVSGGNITLPLAVPRFDSWTSFEQASAEDRERAVIGALDCAKHERTILSPAESINALTIGAHHDDHVDPRGPAPHAVDPFEDPLLPNVSSALGLGYRRAVKPEIYFPGGREYVMMKGTNGGLKVKLSPGLNHFGLKAAAPDPSGMGRPNYEALINGTSAATALASRAAHRIFDALMDRPGGSLLADLDPDFYAVVVKALLVHRARWSSNAETIVGICGPADKRRHVERSENVSRFLGFGTPSAEESCECAPNRATLVGHGALLPDHAHNYRIPLPGCLERVTDPRSLTITLAWFSPVKPGHQNYRRVRLEAAPLHDPMQVLGVRRGQAAQPADPATRRGTVFHERLCGAQAVPFIDNGHLSLCVWCKEDAGGVGAPVRYAIAISIEAETAIPIYDEIQARLRVRPRA